MYYFVNWREIDGIEGGKEADLPESIPYLLIAEPSNDSDWAIFRCDCLDLGNEHKDFIAKGIEPVPEELGGLIASGERFPPALAISIKETEKEVSNHELTKAKFGSIFSKILRTNLNAQRKLPYIFVEAVKDELGYLTKGEFYWIIGYVPKTNEIKWVSGDYAIYQNPLADFNVTREELLNIVQTEKTTQTQHKKHRKQ